MTHAIHDSGPGDQRGGRRTPVVWAATLASSLVHGGQVADCIVLNVGISGAMVRTAEPFRGSLKVRLHSFHFGELACRVVWQDGQAIGLQFAEGPDHVIRTLGRALPELTAA